MSQAYGFHWFNIKESRWDRELCREFGIDENMMPRLCESFEIVGTVNAEAAKACGLCEGIPVAAGGLDAACAALGAGVIRQGQVQEQGGQAGGMSICCESFEANPKLILSRHVTGGQWLLQGGTTGGGGVMRWLTEELAAEEKYKSRYSDKDTMALINEEAAGICEGCGGLVFLPYMAGERSPIWDTKAKGVFYGLDYSKSRVHMIRAAMEGVAFSLRHNLETAVHNNVSVSELRATGGSANSKLWTQIKADVTGMEIAVPENSDMVTTMGAAVLAGIGIGFYKDFEEAASLTYREKYRCSPDFSKKRSYDKNYKMYLEIYRRLKTLSMRGQVKL